MKKLIALYLLSFSLLSLQAQSPLRIGVMTDTHYLSAQLMDGGYAAQDYVLTSGRNIVESSAIVDEVIADFAASDINVLLVCGDIAKDGERLSHQDFAAKLKPLHEKGVRVFVVPGNHDINVPHPRGYKGNTTYDAESTSPVQFADIYAPFGYDNAIQRDTASLSYVAALDDTTWLLTIDAARYREYTSKTISAGRIPSSTCTWIESVLALAREKNMRVVGMMHWGLVEHMPMQSSFFADYLVADWQRIAALLADNGVKMMFTGHFHANDITLYTSDNGNKIYDIETGALCSYPFAYRLIDLYADRAVVKTKNITSTPDSRHLAADSRRQMEDIARRMAQNKLKNMGLNMPDNVLKPMADVLSQVFILHLGGDEKMTPELEAAVDNLMQGSDDDAFSGELDFYPPDNDVEIIF